MDVEGLKLTAGIVLMVVGFALIIYGGAQALLKEFKHGNKDK